MIRISTYSRLSLGLVLLTITLIFSAISLNFIPNQRELIQKERQVICESLAVLTSKLAGKNDLDTLNFTLASFVDRNDDILSAALRKNDNSYTVIAGDHEINWKGADPRITTITHVRVPIYAIENNKQSLWGNIEVVFKPVFGQGLFKFLYHPTVKLVAFFFLFGFMLYRFFLKRVLKQLDPTSVVPPRVRTALDTLVEGVVLLDTKARVVLANEAFHQNIARTQSDLTGRDIDGLNWEPYDPESQLLTFPWIDTLKTSKQQIGIPLCMPDEANRRRIFTVNTSPIIDSNKKSRGVLVTFDDVTLVEEKNEQLQDMVEKLEKYSEKIKRQNKKLEYLATRDPLTGCRNRRSFFEIFDREFNSARRYGHSLSCIMFDIDHFKSINDNHGHAAGDDVLRGFSRIIGALIRKMDTMGRYGGEEFCIILPHIDIKNATIAAERFRKAVMAERFSGIAVTASFGVSTMGQGAGDPSALIDQADQALYAAKEGGRNRVVNWTMLQAGSLPLPPAPATSQAEGPGTENTTQPQSNIQPFQTDNGPVPMQAENMDTPEEGDMSKALELVQKGLSEATEKSNSEGLHAAMAENSTMVRLNDKGGWGDDKKGKVDQAPLDKRSVSQVIKILQKRPQRK